MSLRKLNLAGWATCSAFKGAKRALEGLATIFPSRFSVDITEYETKDEYMLWLETFRTSIGADNHKTSPIVWFQETNTYLGGRDDTLTWCRTILSAAVTDSPVDSVSDHFKNIDGWNPEHGYEYDLVVIGGGSGGLACSKEAKKLGAKVAVLDYVKPSPAGSKWGLGGTCVNVGCIPKKLMHQAALLGEGAHDAKGFGWSGLDKGKHSWETLRQNVQDHIKGLNFAYRVQLREAGVTYINKLGKFIGPNTMEVVDNKGKASNITAARFVIATGGRPTQLDIPGGEYAITSDDIFMKETSPGKTCVIGAGYVALECAGFLTGLHQGEVTVLVRSTPLRSFDKDVVNYVQDYMMKKGTKIITGVQPKSITKLPSGRLLVAYGDDGVKEEFDTVLEAIGRTPDLSGLNLSALNGVVKINETSGKIITTNEQTSVPHVYAIGDIVHGAPELTPVAILAGQLLAKRLFASSKETIEYHTIATAVFTPLELGTVGLSEIEAQEKYGASNVDCYVSSFTPLEWTIAEQYTDLSGFAKIVVHMDAEKPGVQRVVGMHIASPNAGEIIQGYGLAVKKGLTYKELVSMVGIHPTVGEEFTTMTITKSSGASIAKTGC